MFEVAVQPLLAVSDVGSADMLKSGTWTWMVAECIRSLAVAVIVTV